MNMAGNEAMGLESEELKIDKPTSEKLGQWVEDVWRFITANQKDKSGPYHELLPTFNQKEDVSAAASNTIHARFGGEGRAICAIRNKDERVVGIASLTVKTGEMTVEPAIYLAAEVQLHGTGLNTVRNWMREYDVPLREYRLIAARALSRPETNLLARLDIELEGTFDTEKKKQRLKFRNLGS